MKSFTKLSDWHINFNLLRLFSMIYRITFIFFGLFLFLATSLLIYSFFVPRPLDTTDPSIFLKDGKTVNYCNLPKLDGSAKSADDIPKAYTPG